MRTENDLEVFLRPRSVVIIGATQRSGSWGSFIMNGMLSMNYFGKLYVVNRRSDQVYGFRAFRDVREIIEPVDLAVLTIPEEFVEEAIVACGQKQVKGITIITAGFAETSRDGEIRQKEITRIARSYGMRLLGPNVSGTFNLHSQFNASPSPGQRMLPTALAAVCQGGYAFYDLLASASPRGMGVGKFIHTGNECDLTVTDFLEHFGQDPDVKAIIMYLETIRDGRRFMEVAREVTKTKPVVVYKGGRTPGSARAARSHTGALSGRKELYYGLLRQAGIIISPTMELLIPLGHALLERPPMRGRRVAVITMGGSWGVALSDSLEEEGLVLPELSLQLQGRLRDLGIPQRASMRNPVDIGASGILFEVDTMLAIGREVLSSGEVDAVILHGLGRAGMLEEDSPSERRLSVEIEKHIISGFASLEKSTGIPVLIGSHHTLWESQVVWDLNKEGIRIHNRLDEIAHLLSSMYDYWMKRQDI